MFFSERDSVESAQMGHRKLVFDGGTFWVLPLT